MKRGTGHKGNKRRRGTKETGGRKGWVKRGTGHKGNKRRRRTGEQRKLGEQGDGGRRDG